MAASLKDEPVPSRALVADVVVLLRPLRSFLVSRSVGVVSSSATATGTRRVPPRAAEDCFFSASIFSPLPFIIFRYLRWGQGSWQSFAFYHWYASCFAANKYGTWWCGVRRTRHENDARTLTSDMRVVGQLMM